MPRQNPETGAFRFLFNAFNPLNQHFIAFVAEKWEFGVLSIGATALFWSGLQTTKPSNTSVMILIFSLLIGITALTLLGIRRLKPVRVRK